METAKEVFSTKDDAPSGLPLWGGQPPARPLSPKRRRKAVQATEVLTTRKPEPKIGFRAVIGCVVLAFCCLVVAWMSRGIRNLMETSPTHTQLNIDSSSTDTLVDRLDEIPDLAMEEPSESMLSNAQSLVGDLDGHGTILGSEPAPSPLLEVSTETVVMANLKLDEAGTIWSPPQAAQSFPSEVRFRSTDTSDQKHQSTYKLFWGGNTARARGSTYKLYWAASIAHEADSTYKLHWAPIMAHEAESTYKLHWAPSIAHERDSTYKLYWASHPSHPIASIPKPYELRWRT